MFQLVKTCFLYLLIILNSWETVVSDDCKLKDKNLSEDDLFNWKTKKLAPARDLPTNIMYVVNEAVHVWTFPVDLQKGRQLTEEYMLYSIQIFLSGYGPETIGFKLIGKLANNLPLTFIPSESATFHNQLEGNSKMSRQNNTIVTEWVLPVEIYPFNVTYYWIWCGNDGEMYYWSTIVHLNPIHLLPQRASITIYGEVINTLKGMPFVVPCRLDYNTSQLREGGRPIQLLLHIFRTNGMDDPEVHTVSTTLSPPDFELPRDFMVQFLPDSHLRRIVSMQPEDFDHWNNNTFLYQKTAEDDDDGDVYHCHWSLLHYFGSHETKSYIINIRNADDPFIYTEYIFNLLFNVELHRQINSVGNDHILLTSKTAMEQALTHTIICPALCMTKMRWAPRRDVSSEKQYRNCVDKHCNEFYFNVPFYPITVDRQIPMNINSKGIKDSEAPPFNPVLAGDFRSLIYKTHVGSIYYQKNVSEKAVEEVARRSVFIILRYNDSSNNYTAFLHFRHPYNERKEKNAIIRETEICNKVFNLKDDCVNHESEEGDHCIQNLIYGKLSDNSKVETTMQNYEEKYSKHLFVQELSYLMYSNYLSIIINKRGKPKYSYNIIIPSYYLCLPMDLLISETDVTTKETKSTKMIPIELHDMCMYMVGLQPTLGKCVTRADYEKLFFVENTTAAALEFKACIIFVYSIFIDTRISPDCKYRSKNLQIHYMSYKFRIRDHRRWMLAESSYHRDTTHRPTIEHVVANRKIIVQEGAPLALKCDYPKIWKTKRVTEKGYNSTNLMWFYSKEKDRANVLLGEWVAARDNHLLPDYSTEKPINYTEEEIGIKLTKDSQFYENGTRRIFRYKYKDLKDFLMFDYVQPEDNGIFTCVVWYAGDVRRFVVNYHVFVRSSIYRATESIAPFYAAKVISSFSGSLITVRVDSEPLFNKENKLLDRNEVPHKLQVILYSRKSNFFTIRMTYDNKKLKQYFDKPYQPFVLENIDEEVKNYTNHDGNIIPVFKTGKRFGASNYSYPWYIIFDNYTQAHPFEHEDLMVDYFFKNVFTINVTCQQYKGDYWASPFKEANVAVDQFQILVHDWNEQHFFTSYKNVYHFSLNLGSLKATDEIKNIRVTMNDPTFCRSLCTSLHYVEGDESAYESCIAKINCKIDYLNEIYSDLDVAGEAYPFDFMDMVVPTKLYLKKNTSDSQWFNRNMTETLYFMTAHSFADPELKLRPQRAPEQYLIVGVLHDYFDNTKPKLTGKVAHLRIDPWSGKRETERFTQQVKGMQFRECASDVTYKSPYRVEKREKLFYILQGGFDMGSGDNNKPRAIRLDNTSLTFPFLDKLWYEYHQYFSVHSIKSYDATKGEYSVCTSSQRYDDTDYMQIIRVSKDWSGFHELGDSDVKFGETPFIADDRFSDVFYPLSQDYIRRHQAQNLLAESAESKLTRVHWQIWAFCYWLCENPGKFRFCEKMYSTIITNNKTTINQRCTKNCGKIFSAALAKTAEDGCTYYSVDDSHFDPSTRVLVYAHSFGDVEYDTRQLQHYFQSYDFS